MNEQEVIDALQAGKKLYLNFDEKYFKLDNIDNNLVIVFYKYDAAALCIYYLDNFIVVYNTSFSNFRIEENLLISEAFEALKQGKKLRRVGWSAHEHICVENNNEVVKYTKGLLNGPVFLTKLDNFLDYFYPEHLFEIVEEEAVHVCKDAYVNEPPQKCSKCHCYDDYNSKGKDGKWYCYKHC